MEEGASIPKSTRARSHLPPPNPHICCSDEKTREEVAGMAPRRSPRLHPQIQLSADGAAVTCRRSPRLHPQIHASQLVAAGMARSIRRRRTNTSPATEDAFLPLDDHMLREILTRLPPQPSALPRASAVCKRWLGLVTDRKFHRQFSAHHRKPPLLGFFHDSRDGTVLTSVLDPPNRIAPQHFALRRCYLLDCRHGLVLLKHHNQAEVVVCDLTTRVQRRVAIPLELRNGIIQGAVLCADAVAGHVHGSCRSSPFKVVLVYLRRSTEALTCVYSSETSLWDNIISTKAQFRISPKPVVLVGNCLYWLSFFDGLLEFDLDENRVTVTGLPLVDTVVNCQIIEPEDGVVGFANLSYPRFQLWQRSINAHDVTTWVPWKTVEMHSIPGLPPNIKGKAVRLLGYDEDTDVIFLHVRRTVYRVQFKLMQSKKLCEARYFSYYHPLKSFYTPGTTIVGELNGAELLHDA